MSNQMEDEIITMATKITWIQQMQKQMLFGKKIFFLGPLLKKALRDQQNYNGFMVYRAGPSTNVM